MHQYLMTFTPVDSFRFSGESSFNTVGGGVDSYLAADKHGSRRQSFCVTTEKTPPQTTVMGALRYYLLCDRGIWGDRPSMASLIGPASFDLSRPQEKMGIIRRVSAVCLSGVREGRALLCVPAPEDNQYGAADDGRYVPMADGGEKGEGYDPKEEPRQGYFAYALQPAESFTVLPEAIAWQPEKAFFVQYEQTAFRIPEDGRPRENEGNYHLQQRCRLLDAQVEPWTETKDGPAKKAYLESPSFAVVVSLAEPLLHPEASRILSMGAKESQFEVRARRCEIDLGQLRVPGSARDLHRLALLSPARLPEDWYSGSLCTRALLTKRTVRCAVSDERFRLRLIPQRYTFADKGSVFFFSDDARRRAFADRLDASNLGTCGFNQYLCY